MTWHQPGNKGFNGKRFKTKKGSPYRSGFEEKIAADLENRSVEFEYEPITIPYEVNETKTYKPDFYLLPSGRLVEAKGNFTAADRKKLLLVKAQNPELPISLLFQRPNNKINPGSKTTYAMWAEKNGFEWAGKVIPRAWVYGDEEVPEQ